MKERSWNREMQVLTMLGAAFLLGAVSPVSAEQATRPGWSLMTPEEFAEHREVMRTLEGDELRQYREAHRESMRARAAEQGFSLPEGRGPGRAGMGRYKGKGMEPMMGRQMGPPMEPGMGRGQGRYLEPGMGPRMGRGAGPCRERGVGPYQGYGPGTGWGPGPWMGPYWAR